MKKKTRGGGGWSSDGWTRVILKEIPSSVWLGTKNCEIGSWKKGRRGGGGEIEGDTNLSEIGCGAERVWSNGRFSNLN